MPDEPQQSSAKNTADVAIQAFAQIFTSLVETFGWAGTLVVFSAWFVVRYATQEQKQRIIEQYILGTNIAQTWPLLVLGGTFVLVLLAQHRWYLRKLKVFTDEIEREGKIKSQLQSKLANRPLQHAKSKTKPKGK
jgi:hypothetical protein